MTELIGLLMFGAVVAGAFIISGLVILWWRNR